MDAGSSGSPMWATCGEGLGVDPQHTDLQTAEQQGGAPGVGAVEGGSVLQQHVQLRTLTQAIAERASSQLSPYRAALQGRL